MLTLIHYTSGRYDDQCARTHIQFGLLTHDQGKHLQCLASHVTLPQPILPALQSCMLSYLAETHLSFFFFFFCKCHLIRLSLTTPPIHSVYNAYIVCQNSTTLGSLHGNHALDTFFLMWLQMHVWTQASVN